MSGGNWERVAAYVNNGDGNLTTNGGDLTKTTTAAKYRNVYYSTTTSGSDTQEVDYEYTNPNYTGSYPSGYTKKYGDAIWETSQNGTNASPYAWYSETSYFPYSNGSFFGRGGNCYDNSHTGVFYFYKSNGQPYGRNGFRVVVPVL